MAKTYTAPFAQTKKTGTAVLTAAKTTPGDAANTVLLATAGAEGSMVRRITAMPRATVTATQLLLFRSADSGATMTLCGSALLGAYTLAQTTAIPVTDFGIDFASPISLAANERLYAAMGVALAAGVVVVAEFEDF